MEQRVEPAVALRARAPQMMTPERARYEARRAARFFSDAGARAIYRAHVGAVLGRRNAFTGRLYSQDPTIFSFGLLNELRCDADETPACPSRVQAWVEEMAAHFKGLDTNHLLTIGSEGALRQQTRRRSCLGGGGVRAAAKRLG